MANEIEVVSDNKPLKYGVYKAPLEVYLSNG